MDPEMLGRKRDAAKARAQWHRSRGNALVGGKWMHFPVSYVDAYARAARTLFDEAVRTNQLNELAMPCFFLQRHTMELALKGLLEMLAEIQDTAPKLQQARGEAVTEQAFDARDGKELLQHAFARNVDRSPREALGPNATRNGAGELEGTGWEFQSR